MKVLADPAIEEVYINARYVPKCTLCDKYSELLNNTPTEVKWIMNKTAKNLAKKRPPGTRGPNTQLLLVEPEVE